MKTGRTTEYGLIAMSYIAQRYPSGPVMAQAVAKEYNIPAEYLLKILQQLVRANVLRSKRGPRGGFWLSRPPAEITLLEVIEAIEGPVVTQMNLAEQTGNEPFSLKIEQVCREVAEKVRDAYSKIRISELL